MKKASLCVPVNQSFVRVVGFSASAGVSLFDLGFSKRREPGWPSEIISFPSGHSSATLTGHRHTWLYHNNPLFTITRFFFKKKKKKKRNQS